MLAQKARTCTLVLPEVGVAGKQRGICDTIAVSTMNRGKYLQCVLRQPVPYHQMAAEVFPVPL
jgi:hypothetical protein